jgi:hypothetical protein
MELADLKTLIPPGLLGIGGLIPILIGRNPFTVDERHKPVLGSMFVILVWMAYLAAFIVYRWLFFSQWLALIFLALAAICFGFMLYIPLFSPVVEDKIEPTTARKNFLFYCGGIAAVTVAASTMVAGKDWTVVDITLNPAPSDNITSVSLLPGGANMQPWQHPASQSFWCGSGYRIVMLKSDYDSKQWSDVRITLTTAKAYKIPKTELRRILQPGEAEHYEGTAEIQP